MSGIKVENKMTAEQEREQAFLEEEARELAGLLDTGLNRGGPRKRGFALLLFALGDAPQPATYISNCGREDMIRAVEEWLERAKART
jgi:hypothetical protein